jgi:tRNA-dihydrouridine synthase B
MAGITDAPFRRQCLDAGAGLAASEMTISDTRLWDTAKSRHRLDFQGFDGLRVVQIAGSEPQQLAMAARVAVDQGAMIIDINMGCPAKKVCRKLAGSALLKDESLVKEILNNTVDAVDVPVTLKIRTGWDQANRNGIRIAQIAQSAGIKAIAVHGRTRACGYRGTAEYDTIRGIKSAVDIPVFANGDIDTPEKALQVMKITGADGVMIGRAARGRPWLFNQISNFLFQKVHLAAPSMAARRDIILSHLDDIHRFYGETIGVRVARKHLTWYCQEIAGADEFRNLFVRLDSSAEQMSLTKKFFDRHLAHFESTSVKNSNSGEIRQWRKQILPGYPEKNLMAEPKSN